MIQVRVKRNKENAIIEVKIEGHAGYDDPGYDLVCAGVSAVTIGIANSIEELFGIDPVYQVGELGFLHFRLSEIHDPELWRNIQLLLESMIVSLKTIEEGYSDYIRIRNWK
jgi:uncharacterized protein YsxB (DUF464 family)